MSPKPWLCHMPVILEDSWSGPELPSIMGNSSTLHCPYYCTLHYSTHFHGYLNLGQLFLVIILLLSFNFWQSLSISEFVSSIGSHYSPIATSVYSGHPILLPFATSSTLQNHKHGSSC